MQDRSSGFQWPAQWTPDILATLMFVVQDGKILLIRKKRGIGAGKVNGPGGKFEPGETALQCVLREVREESGLTEVRPVSEDLYSLEILTVDGHEKHGRYVSSHLHLNVTYLLEADPSAAIRPKPDENSRVGWFSPADAVAASSEPWFRERIYTKLNDKLSRF